jgi:hypothetical protein
MKYIDDKLIDAAVDVISDDDDKYDEVLADLEQKQPAILSYLNDDDSTAFTEEELDYIHYLLLIMWDAVRRVHPNMPEISAEAIAEAEELNWSKLEHVEAKRFKDRLDIFFDTANQEDLLAFLEDALQEDEESFVTKEGREPIFVILKSIIDCWDKAIEDK